MLLDGDLDWDEDRPTAIEQAVAKAEESNGFSEMALDELAEPDRKPEWVMAIATQLERDIVDLHSGGRLGAYRIAPGTFQLDWPYDDVATVTVSYSQRMALLTAERAALALGAPSKFVVVAS